MHLVLNPHCKSRFDLTISAKKDTDDDDDDATVLCTTVSSFKLDFPTTDRGPLSYGKS